MSNLKKNKVKLYNIIVQHDIVVASTGKKPLKGDIEDWVDYVMGNDFHRTNLDPKMILKPINTKKDLPKGWLNGIPFGDSIGITCNDVFEGKEPHPGKYDILERLQKGGHINLEERLVLEDDDEF